MEGKVLEIKLDNRKYEEKEVAKSNSSKQTERMEMMIR